jgi:hypothetical protein
MQLSTLAQGFIEHDGVARLVIVMLLISTVGCLTYTWGYYEVGKADDGCTIL